MEKIAKELQVLPFEHANVPLPDEVKAVDEKLKLNPDNADLWMERGLALAKQLLFRESVEAFSNAIALNPFCGIYYRHRAHRNLSCWRIEDARADFSIASRLIPDNWAVWYHLALCHFLLKDFKKAEIAYRRCYELSTTLELKVAVSDWYWITLQRLGKPEEAQKLLDAMKPAFDNPDFDPGADLVYYQRLKMYAGIITPEELMDIRDHSESLVHKLTISFGLANYLRVQGQEQQAEEIFSWMRKAGEEEYYAFAYIAAMMDQKN